MNPTPDEQHAGMPSWYDPFQEIRTMPKGWDLSSILEFRPVAVDPSSSGSDQDEKANARLSRPDLP